MPFGYSVQYIFVRLVHSIFTLKEWLSPSAWPHKLSEYPKLAQARIAARYKGKQPSAADRAVYALTKWVTSFTVKAIRAVKSDAEFLKKARAAQEHRDPHGFAPVHVDTKLRLFQLDATKYGSSVANLEQAYIELNQTPKPKRLLFYIHGGGYYTGQKRMVEAPYLEVARRINANLFETAYHFCPEHPITQALEDVYQSYRFAVEELGYQPSQIMLVGDSAGGGLAANLLIRIRDEIAQADQGQTPRIALPGCSFLNSAYLDMTNSLPSVEQNATTDIMLPPEIFYYVNKFIADQHPDIEERRALSALFKPKRGLPPVFLSSTPDECLYDATVQFAEECTQEGVTVECDDDKIFMPHCYPIFAALSPAAAETMDRVVAFANKHLAK